MTQIDIEAEREARAATILRIIAERDPELIRQGIDSYKRDLPGLLAQDKRNFSVAYRGNQQVALEPTRDLLDQALHTKGLTKRGEMFITSVFPLADDDAQATQR